MPPKQGNRKTRRERRTALCYVRLSFTRDADDSNSPERQKANIQAVCDKYGWIPEWYEDVGGHRSGRSEKNRPQWLALKARIGDPDVIALVANDLSRLHRKGWRIGDLIEFLEQHDVNLVLAAPGRDVDTTTLKGKMFLQFGAIIDEFYAEDISQRAKDSIAYRKAQGQTIGMPPFGTMRGEDGFLHPSLEGAWLLTNGTFVKGEADKSPEDGAVWRGYYKVAEYILILYATGEYGLEKVAYTLNHEGYPFRDRTGVPRSVNREDIRRVVSNWKEYGGLVTERKAKERPAYKEVDVDEIVFQPDRAVFPIALLREVAQVRQTRTVKPVDRGENIETRFYPLAGITYCAHCDQLAREQKNVRLRSTLSGLAGNGVLRYRHKPGVVCGASNKSVRRELIEKDFSRLINLLYLKPEAQAMMIELAIQADRARGTHKQEEDLEKQKLEAITLCRRRIDAAMHLYMDGDIEREEYLRIRETNEREIAHWQARTSETEQFATELAMCIEFTDKLNRLWSTNSDEDKQGMVRGMFTSITYDLDTRRIVDFKLKAWADRWLAMRSALYTEPKTPETGVQGVYTDMPHRGFEPLF